MTGSLPIGATTPDGRAFRVTPNQWVLAVTSPDGPKDPLVQHVILAAVLHWANWDDGARMFAGRKKIALASGRNDEVVRECLAAGYEGGWLWRYSVPGKQTKHKHYCYETTLPIGLRDRLGHLRDWEKDPVAIEEMLRGRKLERGSRKRRRKQKARDCTALAGNGSQQPVQGGGDDSPPLSGIQPGTENHTVRGCTTSTSTSSGTTTKTSSDTKSDLHGIEKRLQGKRLRDAERNRPNQVDYVARMERVLRQLQSEIAGFDLRLADDFRLLKSSCGMKARTDAEVIRIIKQLAAEGRLPLPFSVAAEALTLPQPHGEAVGSTIADESTLCETAATAEA